VKAETIGFGLVLVALILLGCAPNPHPSQDRSFRFKTDRSRLTDAPVMRKRAVHTRVYCTSEPPNAAVYVYDEQSGRKDLYVGKTPCSLNILTFHITEYADMTASYWAEIPISHRITKPVDFSDPENDYGEITFAFLFEKEGYMPKIERLSVKATNGILVQALATGKVPDYSIKVMFTD
jgi:hypothetical protein